MTEQLDTAAIRAAGCGAPHCGACGRERERLRAELAKTRADLDAARAERDDYRDSFNATAEFWKARAEATEARIAAYGAALPRREYMSNPEHAAHRALTGDTP